MKLLGVPGYNNTGPDFMTREGTMVERILTTDRNWDKLLNKHKNNTWLQKLYILSLLTDPKDDRKQA